MRRSVLCLVVVSISIISSARGQWIEMRGPGFQGNATHYPNVRSLANIGDLIFAGTDSGVYRANYNGTVWTKINNGLPDLDEYVLFVDGTNLYVGTTSGPYLSTDSGSTWVRRNYRAYDKILAFSKHGAILFAGTANGGVLRSSDSGVSWSTAGSGIDYPYVSSLAVSGNMVFAGTREPNINSYNQGHGIFRSIDDGLTWTKVNNNLWDTNVVAMAANNSEVFAAMYWRGSSEDYRPAIYRSDDEGNSWNPVIWENGDDYITSLAVNGDVVTAVDANVGIFFSSDGGLKWTNILYERQSYVHESSSLLLAHDNIFVGSFDGNVWHQPIDTIMAYNDVSPVEQTIENIQIYPNPIQKSAKLTLSSSTREHVRLFIVNLLGEDVGRVFDGELDPGPHSFTWNADRLAAGTYECLVESVGKILSLPVIVAK